MKAFYLCGTCIWAGLVLAGPVVAQTGQPAPPDQGPPLQQQATTPAPSAAVPAEQGAATSGTTGRLDEIVVTALRRTENLQNVPISATALSATGLTEKAVTRLSDLQFAAPSLSVTDGGLTQAANIRGIGLASGSPSVANGVAVYFDGLFQPPIVQTGAFYDIASVEVLRGPQGTLVGSNSTGGAIFTTSQNPKFDKVGGYVQAFTGNYATAGLQGAINLPLADDLAVRVAGEYRRHNSYYDDIGPLNTHPGRLGEGAARVGLLWKPGDWQLLVKSETIDRDTGGFAYRPVPGTLYAAGRTEDARIVDYNSPSRQHEKAYINSAELRYNFDDGTTLRSIVGYQDKHVDLRYDNDATELAQTATDQYVRERQLSAEINLISPASRPFNYILGGYFQRNIINVALAQTDPAAPGLNVQQRQEKYTTGVFAQVNYRFTDRLEVQLGGRYSHFKADGSGAVRIGDGTPGFPPGGLQVADLAGSNRDGRPTGKLAINWKPDGHNLFYVFAARGYKPGGYNSAVSTFKPETVWNYEVGWKGTLADGHVRTQVDGFYNDYHGFQFGVLDVTSGQSGVVNLQAATIKGVEAQVQVKFGSFSADAAGSFVDSKLPAFQTVNTRLLPNGNLGPQCANDDTPPTCFNYTPFIQTAGGRSNLLSPRFTYNVGAQYSIDTGNKSTLTPRVNFAYVGQQYAGLFYSPQFDLLRSRGLLSALLTYQNGPWQIEGFGNNLLNKTYVAGQVGNNEVYGAPREYGVRVSVEF